MSDTNKFHKLTSNPIAQLKIRVNKLIKKANQQNGTKLFSSIIGEYKPGYLYGTVKTHKTGNPLRPIISQIPTPIYQTAKQLNKFITPYLPAKYQINSTDEFLDIVRTTNARGTLASLDVESLFTNVPLATTIEIICDCMYNHVELPPPIIERNILKQLLLECTTGSPFTHIDSTLYVQTDGVSMGSPLGVTFANFYMTHIENKIFEDSPDLKPAVYCRYVDDCFIITENPENISTLILVFKQDSVLNFTYEVGENQQLNFLDVHVDGSQSTYKTSVYKKPTNTEVYLNSCSECPARYKTNTIKGLINRYFKISSSREAFLSSISSLKQAFINNGYSNSEFDRILSKFLHDRDNSSNPTTLPTQPTTLHTPTEVTPTTAVTPSVVISTPTVTWSRISM